MTLSTTTPAPAPGYLGGIIRAALGFAGGVLVAKGYVSADNLPEIGGILMGAATLIWSIVHKANLSASIEAAIDAGRGYRP